MTDHRHWIQFATRLSRRQRGRFILEFRVKPISIEVLEQSSRNSSPLLGVLRGEGVGPEVVDAALEVLKGLRDPFGLKVEIEFGGPIGTEAHALGGNDLLPEVEEFCRGIFKRKGSVLAGAGGGRFVYDLRNRFSCSTS